jgi:hypothetical protein
MSNVNDLITSAGNLHRKQIDETRNLVHKWKKTGLLEGLEKEYDCHGMAVLLENQARQLIDEASKTGTTANSEEWSGVALPLVRRVFAEIAAKDFVSVQPMNLPSGLVFYLDFKYGSNNNGFTSGTDIFGNTSASDSPTGGLYGAGRFDYSSKQYGYSDMGGTTTTVTTASWSDVGYDSSLSASVASGLTSDLGIKKIAFTAVQSATDTGIRFADSLGSRGFQLSGSTVLVHQIYPAFTTADASDSLISTLTFYASCSVHSATSANYHITYTKQPTDITRGDFEQSTFTVPGPSSSDDIQIPQINVSMNSEPIVAKTKKLKAVWTPEFAQDLNAYHSIDAEAELTSMLSEYISMEIDLEILDMLIEDALTVDYWSAKIGGSIGPTQTNGESDWTTADFVGNGNALAYTQNAWFQTLGTKIQKVSNKIHQNTLRGGANFVVCSPDIATIIESIPGYAGDTDGNQQQFAMGVQKVGMLNSRWQVYKNPYMTSNTILMGYRGSQFLETGAVYAPYVPLIMTPLVYDPENFTPRKGVMTRYAKKMIRKEFFGKIYVSGLNLI